MKTNLKDLKNMSFSDLTDHYQTNKGNLIERLRELESRDGSSQNKTKLLKEYNILLLEFINYYEAFFHKFNIHKKEIEETNSQTNYKLIEEVKMFSDSCIVHMTRINSRYVQPLSNDIARNKANKSIILGAISIVIGLIATLLSMYFSIKSNRQIKKIEDYITMESMIIDTSRVNQQHFVDTIDYSHLPLTN